MTHSSSTGATIKPSTAVPVIICSIALLSLGNGLQNTLLTVRASVEGIGDQSIGIIIEQVGHIRTYAALASIASVVSLVHVLVIHPISWILLRNSF